MYIFKCGFEYYISETFSNILLQSTGLPLESKAGIQCNLIIKDINGYFRVGPFRNSFVPLFWLQLVSVLSTCRPICEIPKLLK
jgi:hypothetical protein